MLARLLFFSSDKMISAWEFTSVLILVDFFLWFIRIEAVCGLATLGFLNGVCYCGDLYLELYLDVLF